MEQTKTAKMVLFKLNMDSILFCLYWNVMCVCAYRISCFQLHIYSYTVIVRPSFRSLYLSLFLSRQRFIFDTDALHNSPTELKTTWAHRSQLQNRSEIQTRREPSQISNRSEHHFLSNRWQCVRTSRRLKTDWIVLHTELDEADSNSNNIYSTGARYFPSIEYTVNESAAALM